MTMSTTTRREVLKKIGASSAVLGIPSIAKSATIKLKLSHFLPPRHQIHAELSAWAQGIYQKTEGEIEIEVFPTGQMGPPGRQYDLARTGVADISFVPTALNPGRYPRVDCFSLPFLWSDKNDLPTASSVASKITTSLTELTAADFPDTTQLYSICTTTAGWFMRDKDIQDPSDLSGLRIRPVSAVTSNMIKALGASPTALPPPELSDALSKGVVDGAIFNFEGGRAFQLHQSVNFVSTLAFTAGYFTLVMNDGSLSKLSEKGRTAIFEASGIAAAEKIGALYDNAETSGREFFASNGIEIADLVGEKSKRFREVLQPVFEDQIDAFKANGIDALEVVSKIQKLK
jgi:TRAP-type C4-dicarboxylate transport system substrate-binding protein